MSPVDGGLVFGGNKSCLQYRLTDVFWGKGFGFHSQRSIRVLQVHLPGMNSNLLIEFGTYFGQAIAALNISFEGVFFHV